MDKIEVILDSGDTVTIKKDNLVGVNKSGLFAKVEDESVVEKGKGKIRIKTFRDMETYLKVEQMLREKREKVDFQVGDKVIYKNVDIREITAIGLVGEEKYTLSKKLSDSDEYENVLAGICDMEKVDIYEKDEFVEEISDGRGAVVLDYYYDEFLGTVVYVIEYLDVFDYTASIVIRPSEDLRRRVKGRNRD